MRPLASLEPTAIYCNMPINTMFGYSHIRELEAEIEKPIYRNSLIFIAWEHRYLENFVRNVVVNGGGNGKQVPRWSGRDFDSIYIVKITRQDGHAVAAFTLDKENLGNLSDTFPGALGDAAEQVKRELEKVREQAQNIE